MKEAVSAVIAERARLGDGLRRTMSVSFAAHGLAVAVLVFMPSGWRMWAPEAAPRDVMTITLSGAPGPASGGMNPLDAQPIQRVVPAPEAQRPQWVTPPAAKTPEMAVPEPKARPARPAKEPVAKAPESARGQRPTTGPVERPGSARADTGATKGTGFGGLTTGGGGGTGSSIDAANFCCPEYLSTMVALISQNWNQFQQVPGETVMKFTIERDGRLTDLEIERSSGYYALDAAAQRALVATGQLPALPSAYPERDLVVHLSFQYTRR